MEYKVSYVKERDNDGTHYNQRITFDMDVFELVDLNRAILDKRAEMQNAGDTYSKYYNPVVDGKNYPVPILRDFILKHTCGTDDKRIKDRNTIIVINLCTNKMK